MKKDKAEKDIDNLFDFLIDVAKNPSKLDDVKNGSTLKFVEDDDFEPVTADENTTVIRVRKSFEIAE